MRAGLANGIFAVVPVNGAMLLSAKASLRPAVQRRHAFEYKSMAPSAGSSKNMPPANAWDFAEGFDSRKLILVKRVGSYMP
jgi:hypothetical protein